MMKNTIDHTLSNGKICYVELPAIDIEKSSLFYAEVFGWNIRTGSNGRLEFDDGIGEVSGTWVTGRQAATEQGLLLSIMVDNVDDTVKLLESHGSSIVNKANIGDDQFIAWFTDPAGNVLGIYQDAGGGNGKICYLEISAGNVDQAAAFYESVFNWPLRDKGTEHAAFNDSAGVVSGMWVTGREPSATPGLLVYIVTDDI
jgi:predicted enzyme related to lactoylglutathione lyase